MAIDPDVQTIVDALTARIDALEASGGSVDLTPITDRIDVLESNAVDNAWLRLQGRISADLLPLDDAGRVAYLDSLA